VALEPASFLSQALHRFSSCTPTGKPVCERKGEQRRSGSPEMSELSKFVCETVLKAFPIKSLDRS
jgi:hypothetical protein